jgi:glycosyltransferase involved in cell wall biosynthesis
MILLSNILITVVIPSHNESLTVLKKTIDNLQYNNNINIIVVDDCSDIPVILNNALVIRNSRRMGSAASRKIGIRASKTDIIVTTDAHIQFRTKEWVKKITDILSNNPKHVVCFACIPTGETNFKSMTYGGNLTIMEQPWGLSHVLSPKWNTFCPQNHRVQCVMGGAYAFTTQWHRKIDAYSGIKGWCPTELASLSLRTWVAGGECVIDPTIEVEHYFRKQAPFEFDPIVSAYNKLRLSMAVLPLEIATTIPTALAMVPGIDQALKMFSGSLKETFRDRERMELLAGGNLKVALEKSGISFEELK